MKDTITLAELRQTELYRKEQTRPLREFLMENIDVLKLADEVEMWGEDLLALNMKGGIPVVQGAKMLRQQQAKIEALKDELKRYADALGEERGNKALKNHEIAAVLTQVLDDCGLLRKAQEK